MALYGVKEVLVPARLLVDKLFIVQAVGGGVEFYQILKSRHEVIYTKAAASESFMPNPQNLNLLAKENRAAIQTTVPILSFAPDAYGRS